MLDPLPRSGGQHQFGVDHAWNVVPTQSDVFEYPVVQSLEHCDHIASATVFHEGIDQSAEKAAAPDGSPLRGGKKFTASNVTGHFHLIDLGAPYAVLRRPVFKRSGVSTAVKRYADLRAG